jgi:hypothetical protein
MPGAGRASSGKRSGSSPGRAGMWPWSTWRPTTWPPRSRSGGPQLNRSTAGSAAHPGQVHGIAWDDGFTAPGLVPGFDTSRI